MSLVRSTGQAINIIESGSNSNGSYIKFNDGTMIQYGDRLFEHINTTSAWGALFECANQVDFGIFPISFKDTPKVLLSQGTGSTLYVERLYATTKEKIGTSWFWSPIAKQDVSITYNFIAIGKWK